MNTKKDASVLSLFISKKTKHLISLYSFSGRTLPLAPAFQNSIPEPDHSPFHTAFWPVPLFQKSAGGGLSYKVKKNVPWHILAPSAVACDMFLLRASAHHWHVSAFLCNREFQGISYYTKRLPSKVSLSGQQPFLSFKISFSAQFHTSYSAVSALS